MNKKEIHLDVYFDRSELHTGESVIVFEEGRQSDGAVCRSEKIISMFKDGFYKKTMERLAEVIAVHPLSDEHSSMIKGLVDGVTSEVGRALVGLTCLQLAIKSISPEQSIRLHKGGKRNAGFSWKEGISMRTLDSKYNTPFLREQGLLKMNADGIMMTRSLAENYPYSRLYKAEMRGPITQWTDIIEALEKETLPPYPALCYLLSILKNNSDEFAKKAKKAISLAKALPLSGLADATAVLTKFFSQATYSARAFEVVIHSFEQAYSELGFTDGNLVPLSQMRSANKKHGNIGDIEVKQSAVIVESWDAKYGKPYLRDELEELNDKLACHSGVDVVGFIVNTVPTLSEDITERAREIGLIHECEVFLLSFDEWIDRKTNGLSVAQLEKLAHHWVVAVAESFGQQRTEIAPIDEPCDEWIDSLIKLFDK